MFHVGQKVVCVRADWDDGDEIVPVKGAVYTVRQTCEWRGNPGIRLVEIVNEPGDYIGGVRECSFAARAFRPVKTTSIDVFLKMLEPQPKKAVRHARA
jgi:hypothetical protein